MQFLNDFILLIENFLTKQSNDSNDIDIIVQLNESINTESNDNKVLENLESIPNDSNNNTNINNEENKDKDKHEDENKNPKTDIYIMVAFYLTLETLYYVGAITESLKIAYKILENLNK